MRKQHLLAVMATIALFAVAIAEAVPPVPANIILQEGEVVEGATVSSVGTPFTNGLGKVGLMVNTSERGWMFWYDGAPVFWADSALPNVLSGAESNMGIGDNAEFIYSPSFNGDDAVYGNKGLVHREGLPAPGHEGDGWNTTFCSRPHMVNNGTGYWISGINDAGGTSSNGRVLYRKAQDGAIEEVVNSRMTIDGFPLASDVGIDFDYHVSGDGMQRINTYKLNTGSSTNDFGIFVNDHLVAQESGATGGGDHWQNFDAVFANNSGNFIFSGDTDAATTADEFLAYNGGIVLQESATVDGIALTGMDVRGCGFNDLNQVVHVWGKGSGSTLQEHLFFGDANDLGNSIRLLSVGDEIDVNGDGLSDYLINDIVVSMIAGYAFDLGNDGSLYFEASMEPIGGGEEFNGIVRMYIPEPGTMILLTLGALGLFRRR